MWFIWIMWVIVAIAIIATIILLTGKGSMLVSGFNTKSLEERAKYDKEKVSKQTGLLMIFVDVGLLALTSYIQFRAIPAIQNITISLQVSMSRTLNIISRRVKLSRLQLLRLLIPMRA